MFRKLVTGCHCASPAARSLGVVLAVCLAMASGMHSSRAAQPQSARSEAPADSGHSPSADHPNIVVILADDLGFSDLGCFGGEIPTPHVDRLAKEGLRFTQFYNCSICGPTRASLLTGLYPHQMGIRTWSGKRNEQSVSIAEVLQSAGYATLTVGQWSDPVVARDRGFDRFFGFTAWGPGSYFDPVVCSRYYLDFKPFEQPEGAFYRTDAHFDYAIEFLDDARRRGKPFFLYCADLAPHWPLHATEEMIAPHRERYRAGWDVLRRERLQRQIELGIVPSDVQLPQRDPRVPPWDSLDAKTRRWYAEKMAVYAAQVARLDHHVGRILDWLDEHRLAESTLVVFVSDNGASAQLAFGGEALNSYQGPGKAWRRDGTRMRAGNGPSIMPGPADTFCCYGPPWAQVSTTPLREYKVSCFEGGIAAPMVIRLPRVIQRPGAITDQVGHVMDILPTCLELAGTTYPHRFRGRTILPVEGKSLVPVFRTGEREGHEVICWETAGSRALRMGRWKLVAAAGGPWELYDIRSDRAECNNLAAEQPDRVARMADAYRQWAQRCLKPAVPWPRKG